MSADEIGLIVIPVAIFMCGGIAASIRGIIRFAQYFVRAEEASNSMATSMQSMHDTLATYVDKTDRRLNAVDRRLTVVEYALSKGGKKGGGDDG